MTEVGEGAFVAEPPEHRKDEKKDSRKELKVRLLLFFDGTLNNRTNVEQREKGTAVYQEHAGNGSYENDRSNIAILESNVKEDISGYDVTVSVYTEGPGTEDKQSDSLFGYAIGAGATGVKSKVEKGIRTAVFNLQRGLRNRSGNFIVKTIDVDCFGFSRGAAGARYCVYALKDESGEPLKEQLENWQMPTGTVTNNFVGLFDTVSSHGLLYSNDVGTLKLDAIRQANRVIQLEAAEEYRSNFSLTTIQSAGEKGKRICLPGAHSDVGGGYTDGPEDQIVFIGNKEKLLIDYHWLKDQGWYREAQLQVIPSKSPQLHKIRARRDHISNTYARIPLDIMRRYMEETSIQFKKNEIAQSTKLPSNDIELHELKQRILSLLDASSINRPDTWQGKDPLLHSVRNRYFHMSARNSFGMHPRWKNGRRARKYYEG